MLSSIHHIDFIDELIANFKPEIDTMFDLVLDQNAILYLGIILSLRPGDIGIKRTILHRYPYNRDPGMVIKKENKHASNPRYQEVFSKLRTQHCAILHESNLIRIGIT